MTVCSTPYSYGEVQENRQRRIFLNRFKEPRLNTASPDVVELAKALVEEMAVVMLAVQASLHLLLFCTSNQE
jgi:hypothetical protein